MWEYDEIDPGLGYCITTYQGDGNPLPAFAGLPFFMPIRGVDGDIERVAYDYWQMLNEDNKIALAVKFIREAGTESSEVFIINKYGN
ncbi:MAG: hypothetical protein WC030_01025 [Candidatus Paceibacterota bacterium]